MLLHECVFVYVQPTDSAVICLQIWTKKMPLYVLRNIFGLWRRRRRKRSKRHFSGKEDGSARIERPSR